MRQPLKLFIADDHAILRDGIKKLLEAHKKIQIVGEAGDGQEAFDMICDLKPDIAVLDIKMPTLDGLKIVELVRQENFEVRFIMLTMYKAEEYFERAMELKVKGYILKDNAASELLNAVEAVADGKVFLCPMMTKFVMEKQNERYFKKENAPSINRLTPTEKKILRLLAALKTNKEIADELYISIRTVQNHRAHMCDKLELKGYNKLLQFAIEHRDEL